MVINANDIRELLASDQRYYEEKIEKRFPDISNIFEKKTPVVIFGVNPIIKGLCRIDKNFEVAAFADSNPSLWNSHFEGIKIVSPEVLKQKYFYRPVIIASIVHEAEIYDMLLKMQMPFVYTAAFLNYKDPARFESVKDLSSSFQALFNPENRSKILKAFELLDDDLSRHVFYNLLKYHLELDPFCIGQIKSGNKQYFDNDVLLFSENEVLIDCGAYNGDTVRDFYSSMSGKFMKVYAFEPDETNFQGLSETIRAFNDERMTAINSGVYHTATKITFGETSTSTKIMTGPGTKLCKLAKLDEFVETSEQPTIIKMDVEGAEMDALLGASETIRRHAPKLAISIYHDIKHLWEVPLFINALRRDYILSVRHYSNGIFETVCYAKIKYL